ncbi:MAG: hypothetical protein JNK15_22885 [Planctomycetes bacterium]|nr:hypothetical protein [Planctomycetota bacterium]
MPPLRSHSTWRSRAGLCLFVVAVAVVFVQVPVRIVRNLAEAARAPIPCVPPSAR